MLFYSTQIYIPLNLDLLAGHDLDALQPKDSKAKLPLPGLEDSDLSAPSHILNSDCVVVGLQVYTTKNSPAVLAGQLRHESVSSALILEITPHLHAVSC